MSSSSEPMADVFEPVGLPLLLRVRLRALLNHLGQLKEESPVRMAATTALMAAIWLGLFGLFAAVFDELRRSPLEAAIAIPLVFNCFFATMLVMLTISNAILAYVSLFTAREAGYLLSTPLRPRTYVYLKYLETLVFSSWSLVLLGLPLMMALAQDAGDEPWVFYPLFLGFFICFVPIPGAAGLVLAWLAARFFPRGVRKKAAVSAALAAVAVAVWFLQTMPADEDQAAAWLGMFFDRLGFVQSAMLPSTWVSKGVEAALGARITEALCYLAVTLANALFLSVLAVGLVSRRFLLAFDRALSSRGSGYRRPSQPAGGFAGLVFFYLPDRMRLIAAKDLRTFFRDPLQWSQLVILFGLLALYLVNLPRFSSAIPLDGWGMIVPFLNLGAVSFLLATFTSRFVFPLVSLEGQQLWLVSMLPITPGRVLLAKFAFSMTVCAAVSVTIMVLAAVMLKMSVAWAVLEIVVMLAVCVGLCGFAVGLGARLPMYGERNAARIANSFGGTVNLVASVGLVLALLAGMGLVCLRVQAKGFSAALDAATIAIVAAVIVMGIAGGALALLVGARHMRERRSFS